MRRSCWVLVSKLKAIPPSLGRATLKILRPVRSPGTRIICCYHSTRSRTTKQIRGEKISHLSTVFCNQLFSKLGKNFGQLYYYFLTSSKILALFCAICNWKSNKVWLTFLLTSATVTVGYHAWTRTHEHRAWATSDKQHVLSCERFRPIANRNLHVSVSHQQRRLFLTDVTMLLQTLWRRIAVKPLEHSLPKS